MPRRPLSPSTIPPPLPALSTRSRGPSNCLLGIPAWVAPGASRALASWSSPIPLTWPPTACAIMLSKSSACSMAPASGRKNSDHPWHPEAPTAPQKKRYLTSFPFSPFDDLRVGLVYDFAHFGERLPPPVPKFPDLFVDYCQGGFHRDGPFHVHLQLSHLRTTKPRDNLDCSGAL